ncbi:MAG: copper homeostasis protein CutC, partial [Clostridia bacterium]|nr:copper homeostasis protein CutC [Clostridia bacterium]
GGFCYRDEEYSTMLTDAKLLLENGTDGLVFGFLNADGTVDEQRTTEFVKLCKSHGKQAVFHRAIDVCEDIICEVKKLEKLGIDRVLTSGGRPSSIEGAD